MEIILHTQPAPTVPDYITESLLEMTPRVFLRWNPRYRSFEAWGTKRYEGRWEIWCELRHSSHPDATNVIHPKTDKWNTDEQCWMRRLQTYETADGEFAPADERLLTGLRMADAWADRRFYEEHVEKAWDEQEKARAQARKEIFSGGVDYYYDFNRTAVGRHVNSGWRWRIR